ncbi:deoxynucleotide monophosphate kinase [Falsochrobactrum ovis]|uniref:Deoxynucleotide monophosphate kinase n=1 Tax=Falsochrobactrum ovis TaxID=1293442 RepID=A0A364JSX7_9HYPH|nr:deoxynucleotide monophosphate kinase [Falsochrobactrum ovis]RAK26407.1 hypothetical protein C7374_11493 [Falsochrobactrum ovis]
MPDLAVETFGPLEKYIAANDNLPRVVGLSGVAGSGKSTAAAHLQRQGYTLVKFAGPLKDMMRAIGLSESQIEGADKENSTQLLQGKTPRYAMQTLGTEWGRNIIGEGFWTFLWEHRALQLLDAGHKVVVDDCRFANEAKMVRSLGGIVVRIQGRGGIASSHESEKVAFEPDAILMNNGSVASFHDRLDSLLSLKERH